MGISSALYSGISGLNTNGNAMSVIGNNIANTNTVGFKGARTVFSDILASTVSGSGGTSQVGRGTQLSTVDNIFSQGTFESTESTTDLAIEGEGFFVVGVPGSAEVRYTRAGAFRFDDDGYLVNPEGFRVQGKQFLADGTMSVAAPSEIRVDNTVQIPANATTALTLTTNLDANSTLPDADADGTPDAFSMAKPLGTSNYAASIQTFDTLGNTHLMTTYFSKTATNQWNWNTVVNRSELKDFADLRNQIAATTGATSADVVTALQAIQTTYNSPGGVVDAANSALTAAQGLTPPDPDAVNRAQYAYNLALELQGEINSAVSAAQSVAGAVPAGSAKSAVDAAVASAAAQPAVMIVGTGNISFDAAGLLDSGGLGSTYLGALEWSNGASDAGQVAINFKTTQFNSASVVIGQDQDGYGAGELVRVSIDEEGTVIGNYSNGESIKVARVALAKFSNPGGLESMGGNMFAETGGSGAPRIGTAGSSLGKIFTNALEQSNVDLAQEFVKMITTQRGFQANSRIITTTDEMLGELINLKR